MNYLYYCTTPFQTLMAMNLHYNSVLYNEREEVQASLILVDIFNQANSLYKNLKAEKQFDYVYLLDEEDRKTQSKKLRKAAGIFYDVIFPERLLKQQFRRTSVNFLRRKFDVIVSSVFSHTVAALCTINPASKYIMMDDGVASYFGNWTKRIRSKGYMWLLTCRNRGREVYRPSALYVMRTEVCRTELTNNIYQLPEFSPEFLNTAFKLFDIPDNLRGYKKKIIWLSDVSDNVQKKKDAVKIAEILKRYNKEVIVRLHPREKEKSIYEMFDVDETNYMWELQLSKSSVNHKLLIALVSTAAFTPSLLYNEQPWLLFTYKLLNVPNGSQIEDIVQLVNQLKCTYKDPNHICEPDSWDEFETFIKRFLAYENGLARDGKLN